ncbi:hypothetical protein QBC46DRAFT_325865 [Diplogelasinospora grovesii]|uniref:Uncharacterized protein n=1 Tax=Diplogelasinospora grovesii TaxID=303347 RepID=A0AAN6MUX4_9PEZI|nr:hypothetical protein QBC46DRAFT_325865 [Diplogelasinospora grovesii]
MIPIGSQFSNPNVKLPEMDSESLIKTLRAYDASFDAAAVKAAFRDERSTALADWVRAHVTPDTLLSADELSQFAALEKSELAEKLSASADLAAVLAFNDQEIKDAIGELNRSTEAISKQTEALKLQQDALDRLVNSRRKDGEGRAQLEARRIQKWNAERGALTLAVEQLSQSLDSQIIDLEQQSKAEGTGLQQTVDGQLCSDDKLLLSLQKLGWELEMEDPAEQEKVAKLREICARLIKFTVEGIRTKLDRFYLEALESSIRSGATQSASAGEVSALQEELESLYAELLPVAQMSAEQQFLEPALKNLAAKNGNSLVRSEKAVVYIHDCLDYLLEHMERLSTRIQDFRAYQAAVNAFVATAKSELAVRVEQPKTERRPTVGASPAGRRATGPSSAISPVRPRTMSQPSRRSFGAPGDEPPLEEILRNLGINLPPDDASATGTQLKAKLLGSTLADRRVKAREVAHNVQESFEAAAIRQINDAKLALQMVRDSILAESPFGQVRLVDPEIEGSIAVFSRELDNVRAQLQGVETDLAKSRGKNSKKDELLRRWGS